MHKICHMISGDLWAGAESMAYNLIKHLQKFEDLALSVIVLNEGKLADKLRVIGLNVYIVNEKLLSFRQILSEAKRIFIKNPPDIIHSHRYKENILAFLAGGYRKKIKLVTTQHGLPEFHEKRPDFSQWLKTQANFLTLSHFFTTVAVSEDIRKTLIDRFSFPEEKIAVIHNGIELPSHNYTRHRQSESFVIGSSGRLFPVKDYPLMVEIAKHITTTCKKGARFEVAGDGPDMFALQSMIQHYGLNESFILKGHLDDMPTFYNGLDIYLNTSVHEGIPMTILEALSHGLPVIAPAVGGIVEIFEDGKEGFLVNSRRPGDFAEKCLFLKSNVEERRRMARAAREKAEDSFSAVGMADRYYSLYGRITS